MIKATHWKVSWPGISCDNKNCKHLPEYCVHSTGDYYFLKLDTICVEIVMGLYTEVYCLDCVKQVYQQMKPILDHNLWVFL